VELLLLDILCNVAVLGMVTFALSHFMYSADWASSFLSPQTKGTTSSFGDTSILISFLSKLSSLRMLSYCAWVILEIEIDAFVSFCKAKENQTKMHCYTTV
jgi:hypothetical protein